VDTEFLGLVKNVDDLKLLQGGITLSSPVVSPSGHGLHKFGVTLYDLVLHLPRGRNTYLTSCSEFKFRIIVVERVIVHMAD
jgi:hypothetical protein